MAVQHSGPTMLARIGVMRALNRHVEQHVQPGPESPGEAGEGSMRRSRVPQVLQPPVFVG